MTLLFLHSVGVAIAATLLALGAGFVVGLGILATTGLRQRLLVAAAVATLALPPFMVANCWLEFTVQWRTNLGGDAAALAMLPVAAAVLGGMYWPIPCLLLVGRWQQLQTTHLEAESSLQHWGLIRHLLIPMARSTLAQSALIVVALALSNFTVPTLFQVRVFTEEFWIRFNTGGDLSSALRTTWPMVALPALLLLGIRPAELTWPSLSGVSPHRLFATRLGTLHLPLLGFGFAILGVSLGIPCMDLLLNPRTWTELRGATTANGTVIWTTLATAIGGTALAMAAGGCLTSRRLGSSRANLLRWGWLPFLLPGVVTGVVLILVCNRPGLQWIYQSPAIVGMAFAIRYLGPAWTTMAIARSGMDQSLLEQARLDGASGWQIFTRIIVPQLWPAWFAGGYGIFLLCLWDVETAVLIQPPGGQTLALRIFNFLHYGHGTQVNALCLLILALAVLPAFVAGGAWNRSRSGRTPATGIA